MSGHSKWSTIKRKKAATDAKRGKLFTRLLKEIQVAAKAGGGSVDGNPRLKAAVQAAKSQSVPSDNIDKAIKRGTGEVEGADYEDVMYEGYGPGGVALLIKALTDNKNRTVAEVRHALTRCNSSLGSSNSVAYLFNEKSVFVINKSDATEEELMDATLEAGAEDIHDEDEVWEIHGALQDFNAIRDALETLAKPYEAELRWVPDTTTKVTGKDAETLLRLFDMLDELEDVQNVFSNFEMDDSEMESLSQ